MNSSCDRAGSTSEAQHDSPRLSPEDKKKYQKLARWANRHDINFHHFEPDGTVVDVDGNRFQGPAAEYGHEPAVDEGCDNFAECGVCGVEYSHNMSLAFYEQGEVRCSLCADEPDAVVQLLYVSVTDGGSYHKLGQKLELGVLD